MSFVTLHCPHCQQSVAVDDGLAGRESQCPHCQGIFLAPAASPSAPPAPVAGDGPPGAPPPPPRLTGLGRAILIAAFACLSLLAFSMLFRWHYAWGLSDFTLLFFLAVAVGVPTGLAVFTGQYSPVIGIAGGSLGAFSFFVVIASLFWSTTAPTKAPVDVIFVLDVTGSMQPEINAVKDGIATFSSVLFSRGLDARIACLAYRDQFDASAPAFELLKFEYDNPFTADPIQFSEKVKALRARGGGDDAESTLDAIALAAKQPFRSGAQRVIVLITDAPPHVPDKEMRSFDELASLLQALGISQIHVVARDSLKKRYEPLHAAAPGKSYSLNRASSGRTFQRELPAVAVDIALTMEAKGPGFGLWLGLPATLGLLGCFLFLSMTQPFDAGALGFTSAPGFLKRHGVFLGSQAIGVFMGLVFCILSAF